MNVQRITPEIRDIHVPAPLRDLPLWLVWAYEQHEGEAKPRKVPQYSMGGRRYGQQGSAADRSKLTTFAIARDAAAKRGLDGVGLALLPDAGLVALDFDHCIADGVVDPQVLDLVQGTYAEYSPSGKGVRALFVGAADVLGNRKSPATSEQFGAEVFSSSGFVTLTGWALDHVELLGWEDRLAPLPKRVTDFCSERFGATIDAFDPDDFMAGREPRLGLSVERMAELLADLDPDMGREDWIKVGMALHHECEGDDTGFDLWNEWSENGGKYPSEEALRDQWDSFERRKGSNRRQVTMATVIKMVKDANTRPATGAELAEIAAAVEITGTGATPQAFDGKYPILRAGAATRRPPVEWFIKGVLPKGDLGILFGASGSGKSFVALDIAMTMSRGVEWRGHRVNQARVLYIAAEGGGGLGGRITAYCQQHDLDPENLGFSVMYAAPNFMEKDDIAEVLKAVVAAGGFDVIIVDTFAQVTPGANENAGEDMGHALANTRALRDASGAMPLLVHHAGKDASKGSRGWSGLKAAADVQIEVVRHDNGIREIHLEKIKDGEDGLRWPFTLDVVEIGLDGDGDIITSCIVKEAEAPKPEQSVGKSVKRRGRVETHILEIMATFGTQDTVKLPELVERAVAAFPAPEDGKRDTRRQSVVRAIQALSKEKDGPLRVENNLVIFYE